MRRAVKAVYRPWRDRGNGARRGSWLAWLAAGVVGYASVGLAASSASSAVVNAGGGTTAAEVVVTGPHAVVVVNGDRLELREGRLRVNGIAFGTVDERAIVTYRVRDGVASVLVDGVVRRPVESD